MRLSHSHKFIFVHIPKTAGQTVQRVLSPHSISPEVNKTLFRRLLTKIPVRENHAKAFLRPHYSASWIRIKLGRECFDSYKKFAFVRNPFDLLVSRYEFILSRENHHRNQIVSSMTFGDFIDFEQARHEKKRKDQMSFITDRAGKVIIDEVFRFENLQLEIDRMCDFLQIEKPTEIAHVHKMKRRPYQEYYTPSDIEKVRRIFERDFAEFEYEF